MKIFLGVICPLNSTIRKMYIQTKTHGGTLREEKPPDRSFQQDVRQ